MNKTLCVSLHDGTGTFHGTKLKLEKCKGGNIISSVYGSAGFFFIFLDVDVRFSFAPKAKK